MAVTDGLTGLHNRRYLDSHLRTLFDWAVLRRRPLSVLISDLDRFKAINDMHGHDGGDQVLREWAYRLRKNVRGIDLACRYGGEEFVVVTPDTEASIAEKAAERIRAEIERNFPLRWARTDDDRRDNQRRRVLRAAQAGIR